MLFGLGFGFLLWLCFGSSFGFAFAKVGYCFGFAFA
jgi:hypothetical protein